MPSAKAPEVLLKNIHKITTDAPDRERTHESVYWGEENEHLHKSESGFSSGLSSLAMSAEKGVLSGGTLVTVHGLELAAGDMVGIVCSFGGAEADATAVNRSMVVCKEQSLITTMAIQATAT